MKKILSAAFAVLLAGDLFAADEKFVDCGPGFIVENAKKRDGIASVECKKLWCRDLENGKNMGANDSAANGYVITSAPVELCDDKNNCVECFGARKWCAGEAAGVWDPDYGIHIRPDSDASMYRGILSGNCYKWQLQNHNCGPNEIAVNNGTSWSCLTQSGAGGEAARSAIKKKAIRRTSGVVKPIRRK
jgi:hypothetical protein